MSRYYSRVIVAKAIAAAALLFLGASSAWSASYKVLYNFTAHSGNPTSGLVTDAAGNAYGTTFNLTFAPYKEGEVYELSPTTGYRLLYHFSTHDGGGYLPQGNLAVDSAGNLYGTTVYGGANKTGCLNQGCGVVFELSPSSNGGLWTETVLHSFCSQADCADGEEPQAGVILDSAGNLYGTTLGGGQGGGTVFELQRSQSSWIYTVLCDFTDGNDGADPTGNLIFDGSGNLYGTTQYRGQRNGGSVFQLAPSGGVWTFHLLYAFDGTSGSKDGSQPRSSVILDAQGNLYGTTSVGGDFGAGTVFVLTPNDGNWSENVLHSFAGGADGATPEANLAIDAAGNLYGTTLNGGQPGAGGTIFKMTKELGGKWAESVFRFPTNGLLGAGPTAPLVLDSAGSAYSTASLGGYNSSGAVFRIAQ